nr:hypothetical protein [Arthrobacter sp. ok362]
MDQLMPEQPDGFAVIRGMQVVLGERYGRFDLVRHRPDGRLDAEPVHGIEGLTMEFDHRLRAEVNVGAHAVAGA